MNIISISIVNDTHIYTVGIELLLSKIPNTQIVAKIKTGKEFLSVLTSLNPDLALINYVLADMTGIDLIKQALKIKSNLKIIGILINDNATRCNDMINAGAVDCITGIITVEEFSTKLKKHITDLTYMHMSNI